MIFSEIIILPAWCAVVRLFLQNIARTYISRYPREWKQEACMDDKCMVLKKLSSQTMQKESPECIDELGLRTIENSEWVGGFSPSDLSAQVLYLALTSWTHPSSLVFRNIARIL
jgi:hypothetical protein